MKKEQDYIKDITEIRSMMERSTKFLSLTGISGVMAGIYALIGAYLVYRFFYRNSSTDFFTTVTGGEINGSLWNMIFLAFAVLILSVGTAVFFSFKKAGKSGEKLWNASARRLIINMAIPLVAGGLLTLVFLTKGLFALVIPVTLIFYGLALTNAGKFTFEEMKSLGIIQIFLGLLAAYFLEFSLLFWAFGFGVMHILYGIYMHLKYEK
ncbi:hypothetical protein SAMN06296241_2559 [Salinimicrobium sediminis]|uniref:Uncharacterized protein n=1 Tax=Salinimicrobium sediminis TaxID=1343891 RepID=A0A285X984_9FLAO|nr:hypothetical protein [Salinimicrobium sediminis]SOC80989.1 hypothetical protein SAMN06296241_2559 [Salinimicrobium sediminis]